MSLNSYEMPYWQSGKEVIGIDEAGRGPLAGPLVVAGCILPVFYDHPEINDSKQLSEKKREKLYEEILENAIAFEIEIVEPEEIDRLNIYAATKKAMERIAMNLNSSFVLTDAMPLDISKEVTPIIKGDAKSISIAAASILAKVTRDRLMCEYALLYPQYGFEKHKGYGTKQHLSALKQYGPCPLHRRSYRPVFEAQQERLDLFEKE